MTSEVSIPPPPLPPQKAYHLETSCGEVLDALEQYSTHVRGRKPIGCIFTVDTPLVTMSPAALSSNELNMGGYLCAYSEEEPTQASSVMKAVGTVQEKVAKHRSGSCMMSYVHVHICVCGHVYICVHICVMCTYVCVMCVDQWHRKHEGHWGGGGGAIAPKHL